MKKSSLLVIAAALVLAVSCEKPMSEAERNAQVEREVQQRLAAERQTEDQRRLEEQQAELNAREQALADKEAAAGNRQSAAQGRRTPATAPRATPRPATTTASAGQRSTRSYDTFYRKLEPYGAWRETADYGYVWQPQQAQRSRNWRPYTEGRWAYSDAGWTWVSEEPFGWATYHYGRWTRLRGVGWVWVPGDEWAPAWVSWRTGGDHVGWAPLPPQARFERRTGIKRWADSYYDIEAEEYVFIPNQEIGSESIQRAVVPVERNVTIINQTTNVTNITYNNTTIVNEGPSYDELRAGSRQPLERVRIERQYEIREGEVPRAEMRGGVIAMIAPLFSSETTQRPRNVGEPIRQVTVERSTATAANQPEAERARAKMKSEATPPPDAPPKRYEKPTIVESTPTPAATAAPEASPAATAAASATPVATATISTTATATATATATPSATATASPSATPRATAATTSPTPAATATATPLATATPSATPAATPTVTPRATPTPTPIPTTTVAATPSLTPTPRASAISTPAATIRPVSSPTPAAATTPAGDELDPPPADEDAATDAGTAARARNPRQERAAGGAGRLRNRNDLRDPKSADTRTGTTRAPSAATATGDDAADEPTIAPRAVSTPRPLSSTPVATATATATPPAAMPLPTAASAATSTADANDSAAATATPSPSPRGKKAKAAAEPDEDVDVPETEGPDGTDEP